MSVDRDRHLLAGLLIRLERTGALSCPASDLMVAVQDYLEDFPGDEDWAELVEGPE